MIEFLQAFSPITQALFATLFTWGVTALGAGLVFFTKQVHPKLMDSLMGFAAGVMIAASFWSLLAPGIEMAGHMGQTAWLTAVIGFLSGGVFMRLADRVLPHVHTNLDVRHSEGIKTSWQRSTLLVLAITLHNIPEGAAVGIAYGALAHNLDYTLSTSMAGAIALTLGIGLQNIPEGLAVAMPLRRQGQSKRRAFFFGQISAAVEPVAAVFGALLVMQSVWILPYALAFAAGAMIFVAVEELIPESQSHGNTDLATMATIVGFTVMMCLDVGLG